MKLKIFFLSVALFASFCAYAQSSSGASEGQAGAGYSPEEVRASYFRVWEGFFGARPPVREDFIATENASAEQVFQYLWLSSRPLIPSRDRQAVLGALRYKVLGDPTALVETLNRLAGRGRFSTADFHGVLLYIFLDEDVADASFLPATLPTSGSLAKVQEAVKARGIGWGDFVARFEAWALSKVVEAGLLEPPLLVPPAVWGLDSGLQAGGFTVVKIVQGDLAHAVLGQVAGDADSRLRMLAISAAPAGGTAAVSLFEPPEKNMGFAAEEKVFYLAVLNPEFEPISAGGIAMTFWNSFEPLFEVTRASVDESACSLTIEELEPVSTYTLWTRVGEGAPLGQVGDPFPSVGEGSNRYRIALPFTPPSGSTFRLTGRLNTGSEISLDLNLEADNQQTER